LVTIIQPTPLSIWQIPVTVDLVAIIIIKIWRCRSTTTSVFLIADNAQLLVVLCHYERWYVDWWLHCSMYSQRYQQMLTRGSLELRIWCFQRARLCFQPQSVFEDTHSIITRGYH